MKTWVYIPRTNANYELLWHTHVYSRRQILKAHWSVSLANHWTPDSVRDADPHRHVHRYTHEHLQTHLTQHAWAYAHACTCTCTQRTHKTTVLREWLNKRKQQSLEIREQVSSCLNQHFLWCVTLEHQEQVSQPSWRCDPLIQFCGLWWPQLWTYFISAS